MDKINSLLLSLYAATAEVDPAEFTNAAMALLQTVFVFDSAGTSALDTRSNEVLVLGADTFREVPNLMTQWQKTTRFDPVLARSLANPGKATAFHASTLVKTLSGADMSAYLARNSHHQNGVAIILPGTVLGKWEGVGFYRTHADDQFSLQDLGLVELLAPHFLQAARLNRRGADLTGMEEGADYAIADVTGAIKFANDGFIELARQEWPEWRSDRLPAPLMDSLRAGSPRRYQGAHIEGTGKLSGEIMIVRLKNVSPLSTLSPREATAAKLFGAGMSAKEIGQHMHISPHTARNFVQRVYKKLNVNDKAALAVLLAALAKDHPA